MELKKVIKICLILFIISVLPNIYYLFELISEGYFRSFYIIQVIESFLLKGGLIYFFITLLKKQK